MQAQTYGSLLQTKGVRECLSGSHNSISWTLEDASMSEAVESVCYPRDWIVYGVCIYMREVYIQDLHSK